MKHLVFSLGLTAAAALFAGSAAAQEKLKIGVLVTLSGPSAVLGQQARDGLALAVKQMGGKFGGREVELVVADDELKPDVAVQKAQALIERDKVDFVVGPIFSNVLAAIFKPVTESGAILISPNAGGSPMAGKQCSPNFFVTSYQNDQVHEVMGKYAQDKGYKKVVLMTPNYQAGKDSMAGFKRGFKGEVADEIFVPLNQLDFSAELTKIAAAKPDKQAGLAGTLPFLSAFTVDESTLPAQQDAALGLVSGMTWAPNMDNPQNKAFVTAYEAAYGSVPGSYAMQAYDAGQLIDSALKSTGGNTADKDALRAALKKADFKSLRGSFKFNTNGFPIQDFYVVKAAKRADGKYQTEIAEKVFADYGDGYAKECPLK